MELQYPRKYHKSNLNSYNQLGDCMDSLISKNEEIGKALLQCYAGKVSEYKILNDYIYQYMMIQDKNQKLIKIYKKLINLKIYHFTMFGNLINKLGIMPKYRTIECYNDKNVYFNCMDVDYTDNVDNLIDNNIDNLLKIIAIYKVYKHEFDNRDVLDVINILLDDNEKILQLFYEIKENIK